MAFGRQIRSSHIGILRLITWQWFHVEVGLYYNLCVKQALTCCSVWQWMPEIAFQTYWHLNLCTMWLWKSRHANRTALMTGSAWHHVLVPSDFSHQHMSNCAGVHHTLILEIISCQWNGIVGMLMWWPGVPCGTHWLTWKWCNVCIRCKLTTTISMLLWQLDTCPVSSTAQRFHKDFYFLKWSIPKLLWPSS